MKKALIVFACAASFAACNQTKEIKSTPAPDTAATSTPDAPVEPAKQIVTVSGKVQEIVNGKDGYTAKIGAADNTIYFITASLSNATDPKNYRRVAIGDTVTVKGEKWMQDTETHILVREFIK